MRECETEMIFPRDRQPKLIRADEILSEFRDAARNTIAINNDLFSGPGLFLSTAEKIINDAGEAVVISPVMCKECIHRNKGYWCEFFGIYSQDDDFCSRGKR